MEARLGYVSDGLMACLNLLSAFNPLPCHDGILSISTELHFLVKKVVPVQMN